MSTAFFQAMRTFRIRPPRPRHPVAQVAALFLLAPALLCGQSAEDPLRYPGRFTIQAGIGSANGARLGLACAASPSIGLEVSAGYIKVGLKEPEVSDITIDGASFTLGGNWYAYPSSDITPMVSLLTSFITTTEEYEGYTQQRIAISPSVGTEYYLARSLLLFFRLGLTVQMIFDDAKSSSPLSGQFDAGVGWSF